MARNSRSQSASQSAVEQQLLLITIPEAARRLSTTVWAVRELLWSKKIPYVKIGRRFLIDPVDLMTFIKSEKVTFIKRQKVKAA